MSSYQKKQKVAVIVGGGVAGTSCALHLNSLSPTTRIILIDPNASVKLCHALSHVTQTLSDTNISEEDAESWCHEHNITFIRMRATALSSKSVSLEDGTKVHFDTCCLASGARPFLPPVLRDSRFAHCVLTLRDTDSIERLTKRLGTARRIIVVGAGGIGMEVVHEVTGCQVVWVVKSSHIGGLFFDERIASFIQQQKRLNVEKNQSQSSLHEYYSSQRTTGLESTNLNTDINGKSKNNTSISAAAVGPNWIGKRERAVLLDNIGKPIVDSEASKNSGRLKSKTNWMPNTDNGIGISDSNGNISSSSDHCASWIDIKPDCEITTLRFDDSKEKWGVVAELSDGSSVGCDVVIAGTGVCPNVEWTHGSGMNYGEDGGVHVEPGEMQTNLGSCIFAAGDCTHVIGAKDADWVQMRTWGQALAGGRAAANGMAQCIGIEDVGQGLEFEVFAHSTRFFGCKVVLLGRWKAQGLGDGFKVIERAGEKSFVRVVLYNGRIRGAVLVGDVDNAEVFENLILGQMDVGWMGEDLVDENVDLEHYFD